MRLAVVVPSRKSGSGGFFKHIYAFLSYLRECRPDLECTVFAPEGVLSEDQCSGFKLQWVPGDDYRKKFKKMADAVNASSCDVVLNVLARPIPSLNKPSVIVIQNIEPIQKPSYSMSLLWRFRLFLLRIEISKACRLATRIVAISEKVKRDVINRFNAEPSKIAVVYHGVDPVDAVGVSRPTFSLRERFVFCAGSVVQYRGYEDVIEAMGVLLKSGKPLPSVVFGGEFDQLSKGYFKKLKRRADELGVTPYLVWAGRLSASEMAWCYRNCDVFVQTSRAEACPNIVLESLAFGCMSISCDNEPMPEIYSGGALYYKVGNERELAQAVYRCVYGDLAKGEPFRSLFLKEAIDRSKYFTWRKTGDMTVAALVDAVS